MIFRHGTNFARAPLVFHSYKLIANQVRSSSVNSSDSNGFWEQFGAINPYINAQYAKEGHWGRETHYPYWTSLELLEQVHAFIDVRARKHADR